MDKTKWMQITSDYFVSAIVIKDGIVKESAPILTYMKGWTIEKVKEYCEQKEWEVICV